MRSSASGSFRSDRTAALVSQQRIDLPSADVEETLLLARTSMPALAAAAFFLSICFWDTPQRGAMLVILACVLVPLVGAFAFAGRTLATSSVALAQSLSCILAFSIGCAWGAVPIVLFPASDGTQKLILVSTIGGVLSAVYSLGPMAPVSLLFGVPVVAGAVAAFSFSGDGAAGQLSVLLVAYGVFLALSRRALRNVEQRRAVQQARATRDVDMASPAHNAHEDTEGNWRFELDERGRMRNVSDVLAAAAGVARLQLEGASFRSLLVARGSAGQMSATARILVDRIAARQAFTGTDVEVMTAEGALWWRFDGRPLHKANGGFAGHRGICVDVTATHNAEARLDFLTTHDALTGLFNREALQAKIAETLAASAKDAMRHALVLLDLDGFKTVNDGFGHAAADSVLQQIATRLSSLAPPNAIVARLGDDEFGVLSHAANPAAAESLARHLIDGLAVPFSTSRGAVTIGASAGLSITSVPIGDGGALLMEAEIALRRAKVNGRGSHRLFAAAYEEFLTDRRVLEDDLKLALARREFTLHYQPIVDLTTGRVSSFEALIRWTSPTRGAVSPVSFIPAAEAMGLIVPIGRWVLAEACREAARWDPTLGIAVNISPQHFRSSDFVQDVVTTLAASGLHASRLEIEITEGVLLDQSDVAVGNLQALRRRGVRIALDDFGTGFSSLSYLVNFPIDKIKIDRSFIQDLVHRRESRAIVEAVLTLAKQLSIKVTAEGVETIDQALALKMYRCDTIQGFLLSKARPAADLEGLVATIPKLFQSMIPMLFDSPLALALAIKKQGGDQALDRRAPGTASFARR